MSQRDSWQRGWPVTLFCSNRCMRFGGGDGAGWGGVGGGLGVSSEVGDSLANCHFFWEAVGVFSNVGRVPGVRFEPEGANKPQPTGHGKHERNWTPRGFYFHLAKIAFALGILKGWQLRQREATNIKKRRNKRNNKTQRLRNKTKKKGRSRKTKRIAQANNVALPTSTSSGLAECAHALRAPETH